MEGFDFFTQRFFLLLITAFCLSSFVLSLQMGETCSSSSRCDAGLSCQSCPASGNTGSTCTRIRPLNPTSKNGVRGIMLDVYDFRNDIWLCHSAAGSCFNFTAFQPAVNALKEINDFLESNLSEVVTIILEDYVTSSRGLTKVFKASGLSKFLFPVSRMPKDGKDWPTVNDMVKQNQRLVVFTSKKGKEASEGLAYQWDYMVENQYGNDGMNDGSCTNRNESPPLDTKSRSLFYRTTL
ncbi:PLC-like phosphodiesterases superfamily protein [Raphanus sativus]|nr:PLC-like phosphodiesterases superfamily protein [Raphanus sativus]